jgi:putative aldouronate transport system substrate-binding protein
MKKKRVIAILLCFILFAISVAGCKKSDATDDTVAQGDQQANGDSGDNTTEVSESNLNMEGFPIVNEPVTYTVFGSRDPNHAEWENVRVLQEYEKMTNVHMDYEELPNDGFTEKKQLLFAGNELPELFIRANFSSAEIAMYGVESQQLIPLDDLIAQYAPNFVKLMEQDPSIREAITASDGHIYTLPSVDLSASGHVSFKQWINKDWLAKVGMNVPTTTVELKEILRAFKTGDPNGNGEQDEIPLGIRQTNSVYCLGGSFGLEYQMRDTYNLVNGELHNWLCDDEFKQYLEFLHELYAEGLLWQSYYKDDLPSWRSNLASAAYGVMYMPYTDVFVNVEDQYEGFDALTGPNGTSIWSDVINSTIAMGSFAISNTCTNPEAAMRWVDYFYSEEGSVFCRYGIEGETFTYDEKGTPIINASIAKAEEGFMTALGKINLVPGGGFPSLISDRTDGIVASQKTKDAAALLVDNLPTTIVPKPGLSIEDSERVNAIEQDITTFRDESVTKFIIGEWGFDKWQDYCATLEKSGLRELETIYNNAIK